MKKKFTHRQFEDRCNAAGAVLYQKNYKWGHVTSKATFEVEGVLVQIVLIYHNSKASMEVNNNYEICSIPLSPEKAHAYQHEFNKVVGILNELNFKGE